MLIRCIFNETIGCFTKTHNKQFKRDSARVAFLVCGYFGDEVQCRGLGIACFTP
ncbi:TPA: DUF3265 domain-containing protein [Vibrio parahaemolyticus]|nr:DUF3265 domain-containing protein [Vibrio parahaemolyticus]EHR6475146.1 DUF3265 domain-containing protein [Vibrio parahaemolyticus]MBE3686911.1 DUF3265 domain-containing protein [Vibrio parahaemolyticus]